MTNESQFCTAVSRKQSDEVEYEIQHAPALSLCKLFNKARVLNRQTKLS